MKKAISLLAFAIGTTLAFSAYANTSSPNSNASDSYFETAGSALTQRSRTPPGRRPIHPIDGNTVSFALVYSPTGISRE